MKMIANKTNLMTLKKNLFHQVKPLEITKRMNRIKSISPQPYFGRELMSDSSGEFKNMERGIKQFKFSSNKKNIGGNCVTQLDFQ